RLVHEALEKSGNHGQVPSEWEFRTEDGRLLEQHQTVAQAGIHSAFGPWPWSTSGSMSPPFGHTIVPSSSSTRT
ncbi:MAG: DUF2604 domain-containing protein, partial [Actinobacteria bacterium]|nr:DUF2604 domain-containing protein [Actinomycetota bacterium]